MENTTPEFKNGFRADMTPSELAQELAVVMHEFRPIVEIIALNSLRWEFCVANGCFPRPVVHSTNSDGVQVSLWTAEMRRENGSIRVSATRPTSEEAVDTLIELYRMANL